MMTFNQNTSMTHIFKPRQYNYIEIILFGLNYSFIRLSRRKIKCNLQFGQKYIFTLPIGLMGLIFKRRLVLFGDNTILKSFITQLLNLKLSNTHTGKGLRLRFTGYHVKPTKKRNKGRR